ncbi:MAG: energy-coupled thiamine transporter ThiT [Eubacteriales bacterium]
MENSKTRRITVSAVMLALALAVSFVCGLIPFLNLPFGGGFTIASMLPVIIIAYMYGTKWGLLTSFTYSVLQMLISFRTVSAFFMPNDDNYAGSIIKALLICLLDYVIAYTVLGLGGIFRNKIKNKTVAIVLGCVVAISLRYLVHVISGYIFFGAWAEWFFSQDGFYAIGSKILATFSGKGLSLIYSIFYNGLYMIPEIIITAIVAVPVSRIPVVSKVGEVK